MTHIATSIETSNQPTPARKARRINLKPSEFSVETGRENKEPWKHPTFDYDPSSWVVKEHSPSPNVPWMWVNGVVCGCCGSTVNAMLIVHMREWYDGKLSGFFQCHCGELLHFFDALHPFRRTEDGIESSGGNPRNRSGDIFARDAVMGLARRRWFREQPEVLAWLREQVRLGRTIEIDRQRADAAAGGAS